MPVMFMRPSHCIEFANALVLVINSWLAVNLCRHSHLVVFSHFVNDVPT